MKIHIAVALLLMASAAAKLTEMLAAASLYPAVARSDMSAYGAAGKFLAAHPPKLPIAGDIGAPMLAFATLEAIRQWQFAPATADGQPIDAPFRLTMNYKVIH